ncbi:MAG: type II toxin-antitoxin system VapC family toxin [Chloroflexi bacterium]|nr:type II toxin-antitoxin system VapC family toxin [Chloroflexota bacterium]
MIVLATHAWIWWVSSPNMLSEYCKRAIQVASEEGQIYVSSISVWEVAHLVKRGRLELTMDVDDWLRHGEALPEIHFVPVSHNIALKSVHLPDFPSTDPADRIVVATALALGAPLVTMDEHMQAYGQVATIW